MARSNNPDNYPPRWVKLLRAAYYSDTPVPIPCPDRKAMYRMRQGLYAFINALDKQETTWALDYDAKESRLFRQVGISVDLENNTLILMNKNNTEESRAIDAALAKLDTPEEAWPVDEATRTAANAEYDKQMALEQNPEAVVSDDEPVDVSQIYKPSLEKPKS